jgi:deoxyribonuclease-4
MRFGFHISIAGGFSKVTKRALDKQCQSIQFFSRNPRGWVYKPLDTADVTAFTAAVSRTTIHPIFIHMPYLPNLASSDAKLWKRSVKELCADLKRAELLQVPYIIAHIGHSGDQAEEQAFDRVSQAIDRAFEAVPNAVRLLLENTAGQGTEIGYCFSHLQRIIAGSNHGDRLGICLDVAHAFAAGYDVSTKRGLEEALQEFDQGIGLGKLCLLHLNDSKARLGSRVDRHWHIGKGCIGIDGFRRIVNHPALRSLPGIMETPRETDREDLMNMKVIKSLVEKRGMGYKRKGQ